MSRVPSRLSKIDSPILGGIQLAPISRAYAKWLLVATLQQRFNRFLVILLNHKNGGGWIKLE